MIDVLGPEKRKRRSIQEKIAIVQQSFEPGMTVSLVDRQLCMWRKQYQEGSLTAVASGAHHWAVSTGGYDSETVQDVMLGAVERRFGNSLPISPVEWLTDNGSASRSYQTRQFARRVGLEPKHTAVRSPESNGMAESFVKTIKRDYISIMPKPDGLTAVKNLAGAFEHYNAWHPHSALGYRSPREYLRRQTSNRLSDKKCMKIWGPIHNKK